jgi:hypothetical protein
MTWSWRLVALAMAVALPACSGDGAASDGGSGGGGDAPAPTVAVSFAEAGPVVLAPGQLADLTVHTQPPGEHAITFLLLGDSFDASLDRDGALSHPDGSASVTLQAPSKAASFRVRAAVGDGAAAEVEVRVTELGDGAVRVVPRYEGARSLEGWTAIVVPRARCADLSPYAEDAPDAALVVSGPDDDLVVDGVPVGPRLAVLARSSRKVGGCAEAVLERADQTKEVEVAVLDRPIQLGEADLEVELGLDGTAGPATPLLERAALRIADATFPEAGVPASILLDAMTGRLDDGPAAALATAREAGLDEALAADLATRGAAPREALLALLEPATTAPVGATSARLVSASAGAANALFSVETVFGVSAARAGAPIDHLVSFGATAGDVVLVGGVVFFFPSRLVGARAEHAIAARAPGATAAGELAAAIDCAAVATVVGPLDACDAACVEAACAGALDALWSSGLDASAAASDLGALSFAVSGTGEVADDAELVGFDGTWVGAVSAGVDQVALSGPASAEAATPPEEPGRLDE